MRRMIAALLALLVLTLTTNVTLADQLTRLESVNFPGLFIRHANYLAYLSKVESDLDKKDSVFWARPGLTGHGISFESVNFPDHFLRHKNFRLVLDKNDGSALFREDATFNGLRPSNLGNTFEADNFPGRFIRHKNFELWVEQTDNSAQFIADSTFVMRPTADPMETAPPPPPPPPPPDNGGNGNNAGAGNCIITDDVDVYPSPGDDQGQNLPFIRKGEVVTSNQRQDDWYRITGANVPNGQGWVYGDFIQCN